MYTHEGDPVFLTADGRVVAAGHPDAATLLIGTGGQMTDDQARAYGLVRDEQPTEKQAVPPVNKAKVTPTNKGR